MTSKTRAFPCNTCSITFTNSEQQRSHMRQPWHICNLRRRVAGLPALSHEAYNSAQTGSHETTHGQKTSDVEHEKRLQIPSYDANSKRGSNSQGRPDAEHASPPTQCLFCNLNSDSLNANMDHMSSQHGLFIPSPSKLSNTESFLGYLATLIFEYKECLYCGQEKSTVDGVQTHMRDRGHCMINMDAESELLDFWDLSDSEDDDESSVPKSGGATKLSDTEMRLPSGVVIHARADAGTQLRVKPSLAQSRIKGSQQRDKRRAERRAITVGEDQEMQAEGEEQSRPSARNNNNDRRVAVRGEMGLVGVSESQRRALQVTEKKMKRREAVAKAAQRYAAEQEPVKTKYYKTEAPIYQAG
ncbi:hypothetical protein BDW02DRAFT_79449 [Decorospora gaudefroyi]|uniref:C2H2-type domain-containing protein n=1 Tax=Decorospora gaudefroyi TaxID=184978 RepID=A0A6A5K8A3_9PLEO|nr:hypothetical protein BDW02DRAFT_79449 [Decorospora gaudefroyi]